MSQVYNLPSGSATVATNLLTNISNDLEALRSSFSGANPPTNPTPMSGQMYWDSTNAIPKIYNGTSWDSLSRLNVNATITGQWTINPNFLEIKTTTAIAYLLKCRNQNNNEVASISISGANEPQLELKSNAGTSTVLLHGNGNSYINGGNFGIGTSIPTSKLQVVGLPTYADNAAAITGGLTAGAAYLLPAPNQGQLRIVY